MRNQNGPEHVFADENVRAFDPNHFCNRHLRTTDIYVHLSEDHLAKASKVVDFGVRYASADTRLVHEDSEGPILKVITGR